MKGHVLIVDEGVSSADEVGGLFEGAGFAVSRAVDAESARRLAAEREPDFFLVSPEIARREIVRRRTAEVGLERSLRERTLLQSEARRRIKDDLCVVYSLLRVESDGLLDPERAKAVLDKSLDRVMAMALVYDCVREPAESPRVDLGEYARRIVVRLLAERDRDRGLALDVEVRGDSVELDIRTAIPVGIALNELVSNAVEHAFVGRKRGSVAVDFRRIDGGSIELTVVDDGVGMGPGESEDARDRAGLGLELVRLMAEQASGTVQRLAEKGTAWRLSIPESRGAA